MENSMPFHNRVTGIILSTFLFLLTMSVGCEGIFDFPSIHNNEPGTRDSLMVADSTANSVDSTENQNDSTSNSSDTTSNPSDSTSHHNDTTSVPDDTVVYYPQGTCDLMGRTVPLIDGCNYLLETYDGQRFDVIRYAIGDSLADRYNVLLGNPYLPFGDSISFSVYPVSGIFNICMSGQIVVLTCIDQ